MENIIEKFKNEKKLIENVLNLTFINFGFEKQEYIIKNEKKIKNFFKEFLPDWAATPVWVLGSLPVQAKTRLLPILVQLS